MLDGHRHLAAALAIGLWMGAPAQASQIYGTRGGYFQALQRRAYNNGYRDGLERGRDDARHRLGFSYARHVDYRDADQGYRPGSGDLDVYRQTFRQGFQAGYTEAFNRIASTFPQAAPLPAPVQPGVYVTPAARVGYRDGLVAGRDDARARRTYDQVRASGYRSADHDYDRRYGPKAEYQREYRAAFARGYGDGYRGIAGSR